MPNQTVNYQCPACGGTLFFDGTIGKLRCEFCDSTFTAAEVEAAYAERQASSDAAAQASDERARQGTMSAFEAAGNVGGEGTRTVAQSLEDAKHVGEGQDAIHSFLERASWNERERAGLRTYTCSACGAALTVDAATAVTECPYCGNTAVLPGTLGGEDRPEKVIPFKIDRNHATAALQQYYQGKKFLPKAFASNNVVEHMQGVYVPFWLFDGHASGQASFEATRSRSYRQGDWQVTETSIYDVRRAGTLDFVGVPADASSKMPNTHMDAIEPYNYAELTDFSVAYLPGYAAERYDTNANECRKRAGERMRHSAIDALRDSVQGYETVTVRSSNAQIKWGKVTYALLPVWILHTRWEGSDYLFAMNGQTGRLIGDLPVAKGKVVAWFLGIFAIMAALTFAFLTFLMDAERDAMFYLILVGVPALVAALICSVFYGEMKTANESHEASAYEGPAGLALSTRSDRYVTTRVSRTRIERDEPRGGGGHGGMKSMGGGKGSKSI
jgi:uncharacterized Zn finger protein (UPF0148 family)